MKLSQYARSVGVTYRTAFRWWQHGQIKGYQLPSGTIVVTEEKAPSASQPEELTAIYTRVSSHEHRAIWSGKPNAWKTTARRKATRFIRWSKK